MATNTLSVARFITEDIISTRGQLGRSYSAQFSANVVLWTAYPIAHKYMLEPTVAALTVTLPIVGTATTQAQPGHHVFFYNYSNLFSFDIVDNNSNLFALGPNSAALFVADTAASPGNWHQLMNSTDYNNATSLQQAYDRSSDLGDVPKIQLDFNKGPIDIVDQPLPFPGVPFNFQISDAGINTFSVGNVANSHKKFVNLFDSTLGNGSDVFIVKGITTDATDSAVLFGELEGVESFVYGGKVEGDNVVCLSTNKFFDITNVSNRQVERNSGKVQYGGNNLLNGAAISSPNKIKRWLSFTANSSTFTNIDLFTSEDYTTYVVKVNIVGVDPNSPWEVSGNIRLNARTTQSTGAPIMVIESALISSTVGFVQPLECDLVYSFGIVRLSVRAPDNCVNMEFRGYSSYTAISIP